MYVIKAANLLCLPAIYRRQGKICWAKYSWFQRHQVFMEILSHCLGHKCSLFSTIKDRCLYSRKTFVVLLKIVKNAKV